MSENYNSRLSDSEKRDLRERTLRSANKVRRQKNRRKVYLLGFTAAACLLMVLLVSTIREPSEIPSIEEYARTAPSFKVEDSNQVTLVLGKDIVKVEKDESNIAYSTSGNQLRIGKDRVIHQKSGENKSLVFNTLIVPYGKRSEITLSDGTKVWINSGSRLIYPASFGTDKREVFLYGEAIFDVSHNKNKPFRVVSDHQEIEVLGTVFNVSAYSDEKINYTVLKSGSLRINYKKGSKESVKITPGIKSSIDLQSREVQKNKVDLDVYFSWRDGYLTVKNENLNSIFKKLSRYYNVEIEFQKELTAKTTFSGRLDLKQHIEKVLHVFEETSGLEFRMKSDKIKIIN